MFEKDLSKEFKEIAEETKKLYAAQAVEGIASGIDAEDVNRNVDVLQLVCHLVDFCGEWFEKQDRLMDKMDKAMDKYLME